MKPFKKHRGSWADWLSNNKLSLRACSKNEYYGSSYHFTSAVIDAWVAAAVIQWICLC